MSNLSSSELYNLFQLHRLPKSRDDLLRQIAKRLMERFGVVKIVYYLAVVPPEVYPLQLLPCSAKKIKANVFVHDRAASTQLVAFASPNLHFVPLDFGGHPLGLLFLETIERQPDGLTPRSLHTIASHIAHQLNYLAQTQSMAVDNQEPPPLIFDDQWQQVWLEGQAIYLSEKESLLLRYLHDQAGQPCHRQELLQILYAEEAGNLTKLDRRLDKLVTRLRAKLKRVPQSQVAVETVRQVGYRLQW